MGNRCFWWKLQQTHRRDESVCNADKGLQRRQSPLKSVKLSSQFTPTSSIIGEDLSSFHQRSLPKLKNHDLGGNPLEWPKWSGMFLSMIAGSPLTNEETMGHLKSLVNGKAKRAIAGLGYSGAMYQQAWNTLQRKFGQTSLIVSAQLAKIQTFTAIKHQDSIGFIEFVDSIAAFVGILQQFVYSQLANCHLKSKEDSSHLWKVNSRDNSYPFLWN